MRGLVSGVMVALAGAAAVQAAPPPRPGDVLENGAPGEFLVMTDLGVEHRTVSGDVPVAVARESSNPHPRLIDLDGDGVLDVAANWIWDGGHTLELFVWRDGVYRSVPWDESQALATENVGVPAFLDIDGDGDMDVLFGNGEFGTFVPDINTRIPLEYDIPHALIFDSEALSLSEVPLACAPQIRDLTVSLMHGQAASLAWWRASDTRDAEWAVAFAGAADALADETCPLQTR